MAPTIFREGGFRFFFFSREEPRMHVHVSHPDGKPSFGCSRSWRSRQAQGYRSGKSRKRSDSSPFTWRKSSMPGTPISLVEITHVSKHGFWLLLADEELFLPFSDFPWFRSASIEQLCHVEQASENHLYWPALDIDLAVESIRNPAAFPLIAKPGAPDSTKHRDH
jgi:hypothetical protein